MTRLFSPFALLAFSSVLLCSSLAFAQDIPPPDPADVLALVRSGGWLTLGILVIPWLDDRIGKADAWPFSIAVPASARIVAIALGGAAVVALTRLQAHADWLDAVVSGLAAALFALAKQSGSLFPAAVAKAAARRSAPPGPPSALAAVLFLLFAGGVATVTGASIEGCAWFKANAPAIISDTTTGCEVVTFLVPGLPSDLCLTLEDTLRLIAECDAALAEKRPARYAYKGVTYEIPLEWVDEQLAELHKASAKLKSARPAGSK